MGCVSSRQAAGACFPLRGDGTVADGSVPGCLVLERAGGTDACQVTVRPPQPASGISMATLLFQVAQGESTPGCGRTIAFRSGSGGRERGLYESNRDNRGLSSGFLYRSTTIWEAAAPTRASGSG